MEKENKIISIDWCDDTLKEYLPWDQSQYVEVKRLSNAQRLRRDSIMARFSNQGDTQGIQLQYDEVKLFEYENSIVDFCFKDSRGKTLQYDARQLPKNRSIYEHMTGPLAEFVDGLIARVNGDGEVDDMLKNSECSSESMPMSIAEETAI